MTSVQAEASGDDRKHLQRVESAAVDGAQGETNHRRSQEISPACQCTEEAEAIASAPGRQSSGTGEGD